MKSGINLDLLTDKAGSEVSSKVAKIGSEAE